MKINPIIIFSLIINLTFQKTLDEYLNFAQEYNLLKSDHKNCVTKPFYHGTCENCSWAIVASSVFSDRMCIKTKGQTKKDMNPYCNIINI